MTGTGTALIVIDVQESFRQRPLWRTASNPEIVADVNRLVAAARGRGDQVIWVLHAEPGSGDNFDPASGLVRLMDGLTPEAGEPTLTKTVHNAFTTTDLEQRLVAGGVRHVVVCGIRTEQCVETTARFASDMGYEVTFVSEATVTFPAPHWDLPEDLSVEELLADPRTLAAADIVTRTEYALAGRFATIATIDEVVGAARAGEVAAAQ
jgi:nicotinamidase-related amidase